MWKLLLHSGNITKKLDIEPDDIVFYAILKRGPTIHVNGTTTVRCFDIAEFHENGERLSFQMSLLDATYVESFYPDFLTHGIMAKWKLNVPKLIPQVPYISFLNIIDNVTEFISFATHTNNPEWVRSSYSHLLKLYPSLFK
jgi:hypothetical protein